MTVRSSERIRSGRIPDDIIIYSGAQRQVKSHREGVENEFVTPAFTVPSNSEAMIKSAEAWAARSDRGSHTKTPVVKDACKNEPRTGLRVVCLEARAEGGRAYKIVTPENYYFDLREDVMIDAMVRCGISKGGMLKGEYIWAQVGSQMKLVRIGSDLHSALVTKTAQRNTKPPTTSELIVGGIYESRSQAYAIYLGEVGTFDLTKIEDTQAGYGRDRRIVTNGKMTAKLARKRTVWIPIHGRYQRPTDCMETTDEAATRALKEIKQATAKTVAHIRLTYDIKVQSSHAYISKVSKVPTTPTIQSIRELALSQLRGLIVISPPLPSLPLSKRQRWLADYSKLVHMHGIDEPLPYYTEYEEYYAMVKRMPKDHAPAVGV